MILPILGTKPASVVSIADALFPRTRQSILALLFGQPEKRFYISDIARRSGGAVGQVQRELERLTQSGLLLREPEAKEVYFKANPASAVYHELVTLVAKTFGLADVLREALATVAKRIDVALIYGSVARGEHRAASDVDLLVIGDILLSELDPALSVAEKRLGREVSPTLVDRLSFSRRLSEKDHFIQSVVAGPKIFIIGDPARLKALDGGRAR